MIEESLSTDSNAKQLFKAKESAGKSGSFMFSSFDRRFLVKTMNNAEKKVLINSLPKYLDHLRKNPESLIARIYGIFTVQMEDIAVVHLLLMGNLFEYVGTKESEFDLKGSSVNREVFKFTMKDCLKDENLKAISKENFFLRFQQSDMRKIVSQMLADIRFLNKFKLMDYSLLLITEVNPFYTEQRKLTMAQKRERSSSNVGAVSAEPENPLGLLSRNNPSVVPEVPENMETETDMSFHIPGKAPARDEFASQKHVRE